MALCGITEPAALGDGLDGESRLLQPEEHDHEARDEQCGDDAIESGPDKAYSNAT